MDQETLTSVSWYVLFQLFCLETNFVVQEFAGISPFLEAVLHESNETVKKRLETFPEEINNQDNLLQLSSLHLVVSRDRPELLEILLEAGANVNAKDRHGITPLMYATAAGDTKTAIRLIDAGANCFKRDSLYKRDFLHYARARGHWDTILDILDHIRQHPDIPDETACDWLTYGLLLWAHNDYADLSDIIYPNCFAQLVAWGADTNVIHPIDGETLAHRIKNIRELESLLSHGFTHFNLPDNTGAHALIVLSKGNHFHPDPNIIGRLLAEGSSPNHADEHGHTALHIIAQTLDKRPTKQFRNPEATDEEQRIEQQMRDCQNELRSETLDCARVLLKNGANPSSRDCCECYCSRSSSGCTPSRFILSGAPSNFTHRTNAVWVFEFLSMVKEICGLETAKSVLLEIVRFLKFEELDMTHTCQDWGHSPLLSSRKKSEEETEWIRSEQMELNEFLDEEMKEVERALDDYFEAPLLSAFSCALVKLERIKTRSRLDAFKRKVRS
jgi:ankyrin repeat protein